VTPKGQVRDRFGRLRAETTCKGSGYKNKAENAATPNFVPKTKILINAFSMGIYLAKYLTHNISATM